eukprot:31434-Pelagococcus_subviridis.AAC.4
MTFGGERTPPAGEIRRPGGSDAAGSDADGAGSGGPVRHHLRLPRVRLLQVVHDDVLDLRAQPGHRDDALPARADDAARAAAVNAAAADGVRRRRRRVRDRDRAVDDARRGDVVRRVERLLERRREVRAVDPRPRVHELDALVPEDRAAQRPRDVNRRYRARHRRDEAVRADALAEATLFEDPARALVIRLVRFARLLSEVLRRAHAGDLHDDVEDDHRAARVASPRLAAEGRLSRRARRSPPRAVGIRPEIIRK